MKRKSLKESIEKPLSAWERRRLYSNQLREKTLLQSAGPSRANTTPARSNKARAQESKSLPARKGSQLMVAQASNAPTKREKTFLRRAQVKAATASRKAKTSKPTTAVGIKTLDKEKTSVKLQQHPQKTKQHIGVPLVQANVQLPRTAPAQTKVAKRGSLGKKTRKRAGCGDLKTPVARANLSPCLDATVEQRSSCEAERNSLVTSCSTPCSVMVSKATLGSRGREPGGDSSGGSTPYHTARSICLSSSDSSASPVSKATRMLAGGTPLHNAHASLAASPGTSSPVRDELNDTFTLQSPSPKRRASCTRKAPSSCLRKGTCASRVKKSVSFTMPERPSATPRRLPKTPTRSRTLQETLKEWLNARGYSLSALRLSHGESALQQQRFKKSRSGKAATRKALGPADNQASPLPPKPLQQMSEGSKTAKHSNIRALLTELLECLHKPNPPEDVETWLNQLEENVPSIMDYPTYWICRCVCHKKAGDSAEAVKALTVGLDFVTTGRSELTDALDSLTKAAVKAPEVIHISPTRKQEHNQSTSARKKQNLEHVSTENMFASTFIDYKVYEKPSLNRVSALHGGQGTSVAVMTPVRRSSRHSKRRSSLISPPQNLLYKPNFALGDE